MNPKRTWAYVLAASLTFYGLASARAHQPMQMLTAVCLFCASGLMLVTAWFPQLRVGGLAAIRVAFVSSTFILRSLALAMVGSVHADTFGRVIGAGTSACWAVVVVLMRLQFEMSHAATD